MTTFTIDTDNKIAAYAATPSDADGTEVFASEQDLAKLAATWPSARLVEVWNSLTGVVPVKKFTDRKSAAARIWKQIQNLTPAPATEAAKAATTRRRVPNEATSSANAHTAREGSKKAKVLDLLRRPEGGTLNEIMTITGWQAHTVRGFMAGALNKMGLAVESFRGENKVRTYRIAS